ncbi:hypothetical protein I4U23_011507 [Adineta vaga]|nr:hypothetical protein I4U23_011507 [Adineta vaga]
MALAISALSAKKKSIWFYQSNLNPFDPNEPKEWQRYSDFENEYIETAYQQKEQEVHLNNYVIDFKNNIQYNSNNKNQQRPVKRGDINVDQDVRAERFSYPERANRSFQVHEAYFSPFIEHWRSRNQQICKSDQHNWSAIVEQTAQGILNEGKLIEQEFDAEQMVKQLRQCESVWKLQQCAARLYSAESFLYKLVNSTLRNGVMSKANTLGPFCYILWTFLRSNETFALQTVYRGADLTAEMIEEYKRAIGADIKFPAFTSTSKRVDVAAHFGNTLFIIKLFLGQNVQDISYLSYYPGEEEGNNTK